MPGGYLQVLSDNPAKLMRSVPALEVQGALPDTMEMQKAVCSLSSTLDASDCQYLHVRGNDNSFQQISCPCVVGAEQAENGEACCQRSALLNDGHHCLS